MPRTIFCSYLQREAEGLDRLPYPGELGQRIYENISKEAWQQWVRHQTMLLNEYRLSPIDPKAPAAFLRASQAGRPAVLELRVDPAQLTPTMRI